MSFSALSKIEVKPLGDPKYQVIRTSNISEILKRNPQLDSKGGKMRLKLTRGKYLLKNENGQGVMEYIIISSLIGIFCLVAVKQFGAVVQKRVNYMKQEIVNNIPMR